MSDTDGWWQASDGEWYPPEMHPRRANERPASRPTPAQYLVDAPDVRMEVSPDDRTARIALNRKRARRRALRTIGFGTIGLVVVIAVLGSIADSDDDPVDDTTGAPAAAAAPQAVGDVVIEDQPGAPTTVPAPTLAPTGAAGDADEVDDVTACALVDSQTVSIDLTNDSSDTSSYAIDINYLDAAGQRIADETFYVNHVRTNEHAIARSYAFAAKDAASCEIAEVERISAASPDDLAEVACAITGVDVLGDIQTRFTATNGSSGLSDYLISASLVRDGVRIGTADAAIENVAPGASAPGDGFTTVDGPAEGVTCEPVYVQRMAS